MLKTISLLSAVFFSTAPALASSSTPDDYATRASKHEQIVEQKEELERKAQEAASTQKLESKGYVAAKEYAAKLHLSIRWISIVKSPFAFSCANFSAVLFQLSDGSKCKLAYHFSVLSDDPFSCLPVQQEPCLWSNGEIAHDVDYRGEVLKLSEP